MFNLKNAILVLKIVLFPKLVKQIIISNVVQVSAHKSREKKIRLKKQLEEIRKSKTALLNKIIADGEKYQNRSLNLKKALEILSKSTQLSTNYIKKLKKSLE